MAQFDPPVKALFFDVFGTCVNWRKTVTDTLFDRATEALNSSDRTIDATVREKASKLTKEDWGHIAQDWRTSYLVFTRSIAKDPTSTPYKTVDEHHHDSLREILLQQGLLLKDNKNPSDLWTAHEILTLSKVWHYLDPWPDTVAGLHNLNKAFETCTLSNGNLSLLQDMVQHGKMPFKHVYSAEMFKSYKPDPKVYLGAAEKMDCRPEECMMVAAHLDDLKHARGCGLRTLYVEREGEERYPELKEEGFVDVWVGVGEEGFVKAAERLGFGL